jgi:hypothetical protein
MKNAASHTSFIIRIHRNLRVALCAALFALAASQVHAQVPATPTIKSGAAMQKYAFIFRQSNHPLTQEQQKRRAEEVRDWALHLRDEGHTLDPHLLGTERYVAEPNGVKPSRAEAATADPVIAILIADCASFDEAKKIALTHPGLRYGVSIEVREAASPVAPPLQTSSAR